MGCTFRARLNQICSIWYTILVLCIQSYLLYLGFERYKLYTEMKWPTGGYPHTWLTVYIILYAACIPLSLLFFSFGFFKSGNIAGDNEKLADREDRIIEVSRNRKGEKSGVITPEKYATALKRPAGNYIRQDIRGLQSAHLKIARADSVENIETNTTPARAALLAHGASGAQHGQMELVVSIDAKKRMPPWYEVLLATQPTDAAANTRCDGALPANRSAVHDFPTVPPWICEFRFVSACA
ncbi:hypothetical protein ANCCEY_01518 [Ancylostoma ceylanicum]|uniref:Uncharacterized protein n=1 Tax=Ancylostoma ceylanicum TaxID=53326 RepID=A0A0D6M5F9_9BILA|nr:hypothetical protein ANCCEY_01518 [Ancylostoma ceylanicum]